MAWIDLMFLALIAAPTLVWGYGLASVLRMRATIPVLAELEVVEPRSWPRLTILSPACDEVGHIEGSLRSALGQDYPALEVVAIDDRSTDGTGEVMERLAAEDGRLTVVHIEALPEGWLGKLNALHQGVQRARGEWLLFADADVELGPGALRRAVAWAQAQGLDLVTTVPHIRSRGLLTDAVFNVSGVLLAAQGRPWAVPDPDSEVAAGLGAFILVRRGALEATPGFEWLRLEVADDLGLGLMIKRHGGRCAVVNGRGLVMLDWYASFRDMAVKMQKNWYAIVGRFSLARLILLSALVVGLVCSPLAALLPLEQGWLRGLALVAPLELVAATLLAASWMRRPLATACVPWLGFGLIAGMMLRSGWIGWRQGGITWRGRLYRSEELRPMQRVLL